MSEEGKQGGKQLPGPQERKGNAGDQPKTKVKRRKVMENLKNEEQESKCPEERSLYQGICDVGEKQHKIHV